MGFMDLLFPDYEKNRLKVRIDDLTQDLRVIHGRAGMLGVKVMTLEARINNAKEWASTSTMSPKEKKLLKAILEGGL